ncbi:MAG: hypothetical protein DI523_33720 [Paraburkholderia fungorum]|jgi:hypothetical protein|nr:MAG: hypothetical protein DI523_33720 [Paraburkholderia fungorum]
MSQQPRTRTVADNINAAFWCDLAPEINDCTAESHVGEACVRLLNLFERILQNDELEPEFRAGFIRDALHRCSIWYFG